MTSPPDEAPRWPLRRLLAAVALGVVLFAGAALVFLPIGWQINRFIVWLFYFNKGLLGTTLIPLASYELILNALLFAIPVALAARVWRNASPWLWITLASSTSAAIELVQLWALPRDGSVRDWVANTIGATIGVGLSYRPSQEERSPLHR